MTTCTRKVGRQVSARIGTQIETPAPAQTGRGNGRTGLEFDSMSIPTSLTPSCTDAPAKRGAHVMRNRTALYRFYDSDSLLLYVGITSRVDRRLDQHRRSKSWFNLAARIEIEYYETRGEALVAEAYAIQREEPLFNIVHRSHGLDCLIRRCHVCRQPVVIDVDPDDDFYDDFHRHLDCDSAFTDAYQAGRKYAFEEARRG